MIEYEQEIESRLAEFQRLTGKGNVKDSNRTLYEILRLMLGMLNQQPAASSPSHGDVENAPEVEMVVASEPTSHAGDSVAPPSTAQSQEQPHAPQVVHGKDPRRPINAPYGFTAAGNVRRKRDQEQRRK